MADDIVVSRIPLDTLEVVRESLAGTDWVTLLDVPRYIVPATPVAPEDTRDTTATITSALVANTGASTASVDAEVETGAGDTFTVLLGAQVPANANLAIGLRKGTLLSGDKLRVRLGGAGETADVHLSYTFRAQPKIETP